MTESLANLRNCLTGALVRVDELVASGKGANTPDAEALGWLVEDAVQWLAQWACERAWQQKKQSEDERVEQLDNVAALYKQAQRPQWQMVSWGDDG